MISMNELLMGRIKFEDCSKEIQDNLLDLLTKVNIIRTAYGKPIKVNDGLRLVQGSGAAHSNHFKGLAMDGDDNDAGDFWFWLIKPEQMQLLKDTGLWLEHGCWTHCDKGSWIHFQVVPPKSGHRIYIPDNNPNPNPTFWDGKYDPKYD